MIDKYIYINIYKYMNIIKDYLWSSSLTDIAKLDRNTVYTETHTHTQTDCHIPSVRATTEALLCRKRLLAGRSLNMHNVRMSLTSITYYCGDRESYRHLLDYKRETRTPKAKKQ